MAMERYSVGWNEGEARGLVARKDKEHHSVDWNEDGSDDPARKKQEEPVQKKNLILSMRSKTSPSGRGEAWMA